ncbi:hypothetical protein ACFFGT_03145 [Mucilaginibacter angelicae]|uniref:SprT-like domain-containing protein n=1 Tax=Mucilaginibacter angelicae TaxID=869718 RepID=A0ABV6L1D8_9SPHI
MTSDFFHDMQILNDRYAGVYLTNKFLIKINTGISREDILSYDFDKHTFSDEDQKDLLKQNFITVFHELVHYTHEITTMTGITQFYMEAVSRSIFSEYVNVPESSTVSEITGEKAEKLKLIRLTTDALLGGAVKELSGQIVYNILGIEMEQFDAFDPFDPKPIKVHTPKVIYEYAEPATNHRGTTSVYFGKYYLYEGIAHLLDQIVSKQRGIPLIPESKVGPEYKIMEQVATYIFPKIDLRTLLEIASISLSYWNCGEMFITMIKEAATVPFLPGYLAEIKNKVIIRLSSKKQHFLSSLDEIRSIFKNRASLYAAANHLCNEMAKGYDLRINNPVFEIDCVRRADPVSMTEQISPCDMVFEFEGKDEFMKDFLGTYLPDHLLSYDLKTFLCHVDYYKSEMDGLRSHRCPLYSFCGQPLRKKNPQQCRLQPRRSFELQGEYGWCNYSLGVAYNKGTDLVTGSE